MKKILIFVFGVISVQAVSLNTNDICELISQAAKKPIFRECDVSPEFYKRYQHNFSIATNSLSILEKLSPCESLPAFYNILESGLLCSNNVTIPIEKGALNITNDFISINLDSVLSLQIWLHSGFHFGFCRPGSIIFPWLSSIKSNRFVPATVFSRFWWYEGRYYMPLIWEQWYSCWKSEIKRDCYREVVRNELISEILSLGFYAFPYVCESIQNGDLSLTNLVICYKSVENGGYRFNDFSDWWKNNKKSYNLPECETVNSLVERMGIDKTIRILTKDCLIWSDSMRNYYNNINCQSNIWYFYVGNKENVTEEDVYDFYSKASNYLMK